MFSGVGKYISHIIYAEERSCIDYKVDTPKNTYVSDGLPILLWVKRDIMSINRSIWSVSVSVCVR